MDGILFDARAIRPGMTGIGNYARAILRALPPGAGRIGILLPQGSPYAHDFAGRAMHFTRVGLTSHPATELYEQFAIPRLCRRHGYGTFVSFEGRVPLFGRDIRTYAFIYDLAYLKVPGTHGPGFSLLLRASQAIARARRSSVLTISRTVRDQITDTLGIPRARIDVVYPSDSGLGRAPAEELPGTRRPYILATSMTNERKNIDTLLAGFALLRAANPEARLVVTGNPKWIGERIAANPVEGVLNAGFVTDAQLRFLYENAAAFVYPSFDEGFGIPLLDAALAGLPVACSDLDVFREVLGDDATYFDPADPESIARALGAATSPNARRADPEALRRRFSWERSAALLLERLRAS